MTSLFFANGMRKVAWTMSALLLISICAHREASAANAKPRGAKMPAHHLVIIQIDSDFKPHKRTDFGRLLGYSPVEAHVHVNDKIQFVNVDDQVHTATGMSYTGQVVPAHYQFQGDATQAHGRFINASEWSTGNLRANGGKSQVFVAKYVGHFFYACSYHIGDGQIGVIVVGP